MSLQQLITKVVMGMPNGVLRRMAGGETRVGERVMDPQFALAVHNANQAPPLSSLSLVDARASYQLMVDMLGGKLARMDDISDMQLGGVPARRYTPPNLQRPAPALMYIHGGGWVIGDLDTHHILCSTLAARAGCVVYAVDYRLAPEHPFPAAVEDSEAAWKGLLDIAEAEQLDAGRLAVGGDSAGGNLSAVISQRARDNEYAPPKVQLLIYPAVDAMPDNVSMQEMGEGFTLTRDSMEWFFGHYGGAVEDPASNLNLAPMRNQLQGLASAIVITAGFDPLRDEGKGYADALEAAGVRTLYREHADMPHAFAQMLGLKAGNRAVLQMADDLRTWLNE